MTSTSSTPRGAAAYRDVLAIRGAALFSGAGALARLPQAMVGLGAVLMVTRLGGSYTLGGLVAGAMALAQGFVSPYVSRLADRLGQSPVLRLQLVLHVIALAALIWTAHERADGWILVVLGGLGGAAMPQVGSFARARWSALLPDDPRLDTALAVESLIDETIFIVGPVLVTFLATSVAPSAGMLAALGIVIVGSVLFLVQRSTEPAPHPNADSRKGVPAYRCPGLIVIAAVFACMGAMFGLIEVSVVGLAREAGHSGVTGAILALWTTGSLIAGIVYGSVGWTSSARVRLLVGVTALTAGSALVALASGSLPTLTIALVVAGLANAPSLITGNTLVPSVVPPHALNEAYTWLWVSLFAGAAIGTPIGGSLIDHVSAHASLWAGCGAAVLMVLTAIVGWRWLPSRASKSPAAGIG